MGQYRVMALPRVGVGGATEALGLDRGPQVLPRCLSPGGGDWDASAVSLSHRRQGEQPNAVGDAGHCDWHPCCHHRHLGNQRASSPPKRFQSSGQITREMLAVAWRRREPACPIRHALEPLTWGRCPPRPGMSPGEGAHMSLAEGGPWPAAEAAGHQAPN